MTQSETAAESAAEYGFGARPPDWQLAVDAHDVHSLADFWVAALGYQLEDDTTEIRDLLDRGVVAENMTYLRPDGVLSWADFEAISGGGRRILFHAVPEPKTVKNRWHIDLNVGQEQMHAEAARLIALGATQLAEKDEPEGHFIVMRDPEGNEFCLQ
jgi:catechol 2,3-dioxygenase-like lactoylglutathione lyase family enzyme